MPYKTNTYPITPYPYDIPNPPQLTRKTIKNLDRRDVLRFFYVEALLRSQIVWDLYRQAIRNTRRRRTPLMPRNVELLFFLHRINLRSGAYAHIGRLLWDESLCERFHVEDGWAILLGSHHRYLHPGQIPFRIGEEIVDLSLLHQSSGLCFDPKHLEEKQSRYCYLRIDTAAVSQSDLSQLHRLLGERQKEQVEKNHFQDPHPIKDPRAWLYYLRCYDLRNANDGLSHAEVGKRAYGTYVGHPRSWQAATHNKTVHRQSIRACERIRGLIKCAEKGPWLLSRL